MSGTDHDSPVHQILLPDLPVDIGPFVGRIAVDTTTAGAGEAGRASVAEGRIEVDANLVFSLAASEDQAGLGSQVGDYRILPVAPLQSLGSRILEGAHEDPADALEALAEEPVALPVAFDDDGVLRLIAWRADEDTKAELSIYSSAAAVLNDFAATGPLFIFRHGASLVDYVGRRTDLISSVAVDPVPGGADRVVFPSELFALIRSDAEAATEKELGGPAQDGAPARTSTPEQGSGPVQDGASGQDGGPLPAPTGFTLNLSGDWARIDLAADNAERERWIRRLVKDRTRQLSDAGALLRQEMRAWLDDASSQAKANGGLEFAFSTARIRSVTLALSVVTYWRKIMTNNPGGAFATMRAHMEESCAPDDELTVVDSGGDRVLRAIRNRFGAPELGGSDVPMLFLDYWIEVPGDPLALAHIAFSTPHVAIRETVTALCDAIALQGTWTFPGELGPGRGESAEAGPNDE
ncbi:hypothetical protein HMPREF1317_1766 [Schaalia georgiae F0490]|uniref:Uncharacterized protein n=2 Tax=Schaalia georgiae TaxID=52768 RepID=J0X1R7_9ACTO|nr:hypothetical protein [Schaalia georgiae]EJF42551.1 hypothetical protein HMPREF1317_1766 [Schaalia georgiae F0490]